MAEVTQIFEQCVCALLIRMSSYFASKNCHGCKIEHPSQREHIYAGYGCLDSPSAQCCAQWKKSIEMLSSQEGAPLLQALFTKVMAELNLPAADFSVQGAAAATALTDSKYAEKLYEKVWNLTDEDNTDKVSDENWELVYASAFEMFKAAAFDN